MTTIMMSRTQMLQARVPSVAGAHQSGSQVQSTLDALAESRQSFMAQHSFVQERETDPACLILMHEPATEVFLSSLHPEGNLFERPLSHREAQQHHRSLVEGFMALGIPVIKVRRRLGVWGKELEKHCQCTQADADIAQAVEERKLTLARARSLPIGLANGGVGARRAIANGGG